MKKLTVPLMLLLFLIPSPGFGKPDADSIASKETGERPATQDDAADAVEVNEIYMVEQRVKNLPSKHAKTVDLYISKMASIPGATDLGWQVHEIENGYDVTREIQKGLKVFTFKWRVSDTGEIIPISKKAKDITKKTKPVPEN
jgi:hypothetical protein